MLIGDIAPSYAFAGRLLDRKIEGGKLYRCKRCHFVFRYPQLTVAELNALYRSGDEKSWSSNTTQRNDWRVIRNWLMPKKGIERILDIGCFDGGLLEYLGRDYCWLGIELHERAASHAQSRGVQIVGHNFKDIPVLQPPVDAVIAVDVLEHASDPKSLLRAATSCVRPGGYVVISTGNSDAGTWRLMGSRYWYCHIAEHISFINPYWVRYVAPQLGLKIELIELFSHAEGRVRLRQKLYEASANLLLRVSPRLFALMRRFGIGWIDHCRYPDMALTPPYWMSARDHMMVVFRKITRE